jgi:3-deoxy-7-phosphoheptulonate synthase
VTATPAVVLIVRLAAEGAAEGVRALGAVLGLGSDDPRWRRYGERLVSAWPEPLAEATVDRLEKLDAVERVFVLRDGERLTSRWPLPGSSRVALGRGIAGGDEPVLIAGPCTVESEAQLMETAEGVAAAGAHALRGGAFKPRTSPYSFGGLGEKGLELLAAARAHTGLPVVSEVLEAEQLDRVAARIDVLQIGSRNMHNASLLFRAGAHPSGRPLLLKRGFGATVDELLHAAEYVLLGRLAAGHEAPGLMLCERGIRTFETSTRFSLDPGVIGVLKARTHLPVLADPSHAAGSRELVVPLGRAALAAGAHGLIVEVHLDPERAWCDGEHAIGLGDLGELASLRAR